MSAIQRIKDKLVKYPQVKYVVTTTSIVVYPLSSNGFAVSLHTSRPSSEHRYTVHFDGWHEDFESEEEALNCFAFGLSDSCRLRVAKRGRRRYRWTVEAFTDGGWREDSTVGLFMFPFWRQRVIVYLQNDLIAGHSGRRQLL